MNLNSKKSTWHGAIPIKILKQFCDSYLPITTKIINESITEETFPSELKLAAETPAFTKLDYMNKENYRPVSLLSHMSKIFERIFYNQLNDFMKDKLSNIVTGFRKGHSAQHSLLIMTKKWKRAFNDFRIIQNWFHKNLIVLNAKKCHYMRFGIGSENDNFIFDWIKLTKSCEEKILDVIIDDELKFDPHIRSMCKKAAQKLGVLNGMSSLLDPEKKKLVDVWFSKI